MQNAPNALPLRTRVLAHRLGLRTAPTSAFDSPSGRAKSRATSWLTICVLSCITAVAWLATDFSIVWQGWALPVILTSTLLSFSFFYGRVRKIDDGRISETFHEAAILMAYGPPAAALSYVIVVPCLPLWDGEFHAIDMALGFDWVAWHQLVESRPRLAALLALFYASSLPHIAVVLVATGLAGYTNRTRELNTLLIATSLPIVLISGAVPAFGALAYYGIDIEKAVHLSHYEGLRDGSFRLIDPRQLLGIITFPSFHTAISIVLVWVVRGIPALFWPTSLLALGQLVSIPTEGGHYFVDMLGGAAVTCIAIFFLCRKRESADN